MSIKITFVGDALMDGEMVKHLSSYRNEQGKLDFHSSFKPMVSMFSNADFVLANLETPITDDESQYTSKQWEFGTAYEFAEALYDVGVDYVATANNHCLDRGVPGLIKTLDLLDKIGLVHSGVDRPGEAKKRLIVEIGGVKVGLLSYTYGTNAISNRQYLGIRKNRKLVNLLQEQEGALDRYDPLAWYLSRHPNKKIKSLRDSILRKIWPENDGKEWYEKRTFSLYRKSLLNKELRDLKRLGADLTAIYLHVGGQYNQEPNSMTNEMVRWLQKKKCNIIIGNHEHVVHGCIHNLPNNQMATYAIGNFLGSAGTLHAPYDRYAQYSIAVHVFIDEHSKSLTKITFSVLVSKMNDNGTFEVWPVLDLMNVSSTGNAKKLEKDCLEVAKLFSGKCFDSAQSEFLLCSKQF